MADLPTLTGPVAMITGTYPSLSMTFVDREVRALRAMGCDVVTFTLRQPTQKSVSGDFQAAEAKRVISLYAMSRQPKDFIAAFLMAVMRPLRLASTVRLAVQSYTWKDPGLIRQLAYLCAAILMARQLRQRGITHIHNHLGDSSGTVAMLTAELTGTPFSITLHGPEIFDEAVRWHLRRKIARAQFVACISKFCRARAMLNADPSDWSKLEIVRCGVELTQYPAKACNSDGRRLLFVGRLEIRKGITTLIEAMSLLRRHGCSTYLTVVGQGAMRPDIEGQISAVGLAEVVELAGPMDEAGVAKALGLADIVIVPSLSEGLPVILMEAMACGLPVIASSVDGIPELVSDGVTGLLVPPADAKALAAAIQRLMSSPELRVRFGRSGQQRVQRDHDAARNARSLLDLIASCSREKYRTFDFSHSTA